MLRWVIAIWMSFLAVAAGAETRVALVIGNSAYDNAAQLPNPQRDATAIARRLEHVGFEVTLGIDLDYREFLRHIGRFARKASEADISLVYYAGHGIELSGTNYLIPTDALMEHEAEADIEAIPLQTLIEKAGLARQLSIVLVDACRDNPFVSKITRLNASRSLSRGLAPLKDLGRGQVVSFATAPGATAADGEGEHSPYAAALLELLDEPGVEISFFFRRLRDSVRERTGGVQTPIFESDLPGREIHLVPPLAAREDTGISESSETKRSTESHENEFYASTYRSAVSELTECDRLAGYDWHPRVPDGHVAFDAIEPEKAFAACQKAILEYPEEWFFYFLAGRALWAGDTNDARIKRYMELGGRADPAFAYERLGMIAEHGYSGQPVDVALAAENYNKAMEAGDDTAIMSLASLYADADPPDYGKALAYYDRAIEMGMSTAPNAVGQLHIKRLLPGASDAEGVRYYQMGCEMGHMTACGNIGWAHANDRVPEPDLALAQRYLSMACDANEGFACRSLAHLHVDKRIGGADSATGFALFEKGCRLGDANACGNVGWMHSHGTAPNPDLQVAIEMLDRACQSREAWTCRALGHLHEDKLFDGANDAEALRLFALSCQLGDANGCANEGWMHKVRRTPQPDMQLALARLTAACGRTESWTCTNLGDMYEFGHLGRVDFQTAASWFEKGCEVDNGLSCGRLADLHEDGDLGEKNFEEAFRLFQKGCELGDAWSCARAASLHEAGEGTRLDLVAASELYRKGCDGGNAWGCGRLAILVNEGKGVTQDHAEAFRLTLKSCDGDTAYFCGYAAAMLELEEVPANPVRGLALRKKACALKHGFSCGRLGWGPYADLGAGPAAGDYLVMSLEAGSRFVFDNYKSFGRSLTRDLQRALKNRGYYTGAIDGVIGQGSLAALERAYAA